MQQQSAVGRGKSSSNTASPAELEQQYRVQLDVLRQLEKRVRDQFQTQKKQHGSSNNTALIKLERDFERVQATAQSCRAKVTKLQKQQQQRNAAAANQTEATNAFQQEQKKFQLQMQEDVSSRECIATGKIAAVAVRLAINSELFFFLRLTFYSRLFNLVWRSMQQYTISNNSRRKTW